MAATAKHPDANAFRRLLVIILHLLVHMASTQQPDGCRKDHANRKRSNHRERGSVEYSAFQHSWALVFCATVSQVSTFEAQMWSSANQADRRVSSSDPALKSLARASVNREKITDQGESAIAELLGTAFALGVMDVERAEARVSTPSTFWHCRKGVGDGTD